MVPRSRDEAIVRVPFRTEFLEGLTIDQLHSLVEYEKICNKTVIHGEPLRDYFASISRPDLSHLAETIRRRLNEETDALARFSEIGLDPFVEDLRHAQLPFDVHFVSESDIQQMTSVGARSRACYTAGTIYFGGEPPDLRERTYQIASRGVFGNDLFHEVFHGLQDNGGRDVFWSIGDVISSISHPMQDNPQVALAEAHAWLCTLRGFRDEVLIQTIRQSYRFETNMHLQAAFAVIRELACLGLSDAGIAAFVGRSMWDEMSSSYALLETTRDEILAARSKSKDRLAAKVAKHKLIDRILAIRAVGIAREVCNEGMLKSSPASFHSAAILV